jgi:hypothetical protein
VIGRRAVLGGVAAVAAGGNPVQRPDQRLTGISRAGTGPAPQQQFVRATVVVIYGNGLTGVFVYEGKPRAGNPPVVDIAPPGVTTDPYGNVLPGVAGGVVSASALTYSELTGGNILIGVIGAAGEPSSLFSNSTAYDGFLAISSGVAALGDDAATIGLYESSTGTPGVVVGVNNSGRETAALLEVQGTVAAELVEAIVGGAAETWHTPSSFGTGWQDGPSAGSDQPFQYRLNPDGTLGLVGAVSTTSATPSSTITPALPSGYQPATQQAFGGIMNNGGAISAVLLRINTAGAIQIVPTPSAVNVSVYLTANVRLT